MKKLFLIFTGLALMLTSCEPQDAMDLDHFTQAQIDVLQVLNGTFQEVDEAEFQIIVLEKYNPPRESLVLDLVTILTHGKIRIPMPEEESTYTAYLDCYFVVSEDGNTITLITAGGVPLEFVFDFELISNTSFRMRLNEDGDVGDWFTFTKI